MTPASFDLSDLHLDQSISGWDVAFAVITLALTWLAGRLVRRGVLDLIGRLPYGISEDLRRLTARIAKYFVWVVGIGVAVGFLGAQVQPLLTAAIIVAVIAVLALRGVAENFGAGLVIQSRRSIQLGDYIEALGHVGTVTAVNGRAVVLETLDGQTIHLPNAEVLKHPIVNDSAHGRRRSDIEVRITTSVDRADQIHDIIAAAVAATTSVDSTVAPRIATIAAEPNRLTIQIKVWHQPTAGVKARSDVIHTVAARLAAEHFDAVVQTPPPVPPLTPPAQL